MPMTSDAPSNMREPTCNGIPTAPKRLRRWPGLYSALGRSMPQTPLLRRLAASGDISANAAYYLAKISVHKGDTPQAVTLLTAALETTPNFTKRDEAASLLGQLK